jgi:hypothetical protein
MRRSAPALNFQPVLAMAFVPFCANAIPAEAAMAKAAKPTFI